MSENLEHTFFQVIADNYPVLITAILGSSITTAVVNYFLRKKERVKEETKQASFLAHEIAILLERYILSTFNMIAEDEDAFHRRLQADYYHDDHELTSVPDLPELPKVEGYHLLDTKLRNDIYEMFDLINIANDKLSASFEHLEDMEFLDGIISAKANVSLQAWKLAKKLRKEYSLGDRSLTFDDFDRIAFLKEKTTK